MSQVAAKKAYADSRSLECQIALALIKRYMTGEDLLESVLNDLQTHLVSCPECMAVAKGEAQPLQAPKIDWSTWLGVVRHPKNIAMFVGLAIVLLLMGTVFHNPTAMLGPTVGAGKADADETSAKTTSDSTKSAAKTTDVTDPDTSSSPEIADKKQPGSDPSDNSESNEKTASASAALAALQVSEANNPPPDSESASDTKTSKSNKIDVEGLKSLSGVAVSGSDPETKKSDAPEGDQTAKGTKAASESKKPKAEAATKPVDTPKPAEKESETPKIVEVSEHQAKPKSKLKGSIKATGKTAKRTQSSGHKGSAKNKAKKTSGQGSSETVIQSGQKISRHGGGQDHSAPKDPLADVDIFDKSGKPIH